MTDDDDDDDDSGAGHDRTAAVRWRASDLHAGVSRSSAVLAKQRQPPATVEQNNYYKLDQSGRMWKMSFGSRLASCQRGWEKCLPSVKMATLYD
ncbi:hypothetical protein T4B_3485 [Trichinella pseudospiralis]|uniref:Uncharacterized protein n=1 Tax=Trichinella pseudospiralis TaxID=6337 RepID=A0A0V1IFN7_TRIPS|nr:hypothetical protein T4A_674 [Trichinella pseudospiralis]KRZ21560.1 hypothetical protein T4B_3485 [Trichinella pseudospiralis]KRZ27505.1 hypothetical protein T4C_9005 [Trichinella pseudospiralis]